MYGLFTNFNFWLIAVSLLVLVAERIRPWRPQRLLRPEIRQDLFWFIFNSFVVVSVLGWLFDALRHPVDYGFRLVTGSYPFQMGVLNKLPLWQQAIVILVAGDFLEYLVHNSLHRVPVLWRFHRIHHSIHVMDWIGNLRFHWVELLVYFVVKYAPMTALGGEARALLVTSVFSLSIGHLNHSNLNISWGPLRYVLNSPRLHIWHHDKIPRGNYGVVFSAWDWMFGTAYMPVKIDMPDSIGYSGDEHLPKSLLWRFALPFLDSPKAPRKGQEPRISS